MRRIFLIFGVSFLATQMTRPYIPVVVEGLAGTGPGLASAIALVMGTAALVGGVISPLGGVLGDRIGFRPVLVGALDGRWRRPAGMPFVSSVPALAGLAVVSGAATATVSAMVFGLLAIDVPPERRSATRTSSTCRCTRRASSDGRRSVVTATSVAGAFWWRPRSSSSGPWSSGDTAVAASRVVADRV